MIKKIHIFLILIVGFILMPNIAFACETKIEKSCCKKETTQKAEKTDYCKSNHSKEKDNSCNGKCKHSTCVSSSSVSFSLISFYEINFRNNHFDFSTEKQKFEFLLAWWR